MKIISFLGKAAFLFILALPVFGDSSVWKVSKNGNHVFIAGTVHLLKQSDYPLPSEFEQAYQGSEYLILEADVSGMQSLEMQQKILQKVMYTDGRTLQSVLSPEVYSQLEEYFKTKNIPLQALNLMKPAIVATQMSLLEMQSLGMTQAAGVETYFSSKALGDGKETGFLETIDQQIDMLANLGEGYEDDLMRYTLSDLEGLAEMMDTMTAAWKSGDLEVLNDLMIKPMMDEFSDVYQTLMVDRNNAWIPQIESLFDDSKIELVLVGAGHLTGKDSVLNMLKTRGYKIDQL